MIRPLAIALLLSGCAISIPTRFDRECQADGASGYVGQIHNARIEAIVKAKTRADTVRVLAADTIVTQEFRAGRVNIALNEKNRIARIYCG